MKSKPKLNKKHSLQLGCWLELCLFALDCVLTMHTCAMPPYLQGPSAGFHPLFGPVCASFRVVMSQCCVHISLCELTHTKPCTARLLHDSRPLLTETTTVQETQRRLEVFTPAFQRLVTVVAHNVQYPSDHDQWHEDEVQDFKQGRYAIAEALEDAAGKTQSDLLVHGAC